MTAEYHIFTSENHGSVGADGIAVKGSMRLWLAAPALLLLLIAPLASAQGFGCQKRLGQFCPGWDAPEAKQFCISCVHANLKALEPNCTLARAVSKCDNPPSPSPPGVPVGPLPLPPTRPTSGAPRPHIVLFVVDDMGWAGMGYHNPGNVFTPNFDQEAKNGIVLERHYSFRWCAPTRSALMTGRLPYHVLWSTNYVSGDMNMIPAKLKQVGYSTHQIGKWHLGGLLTWMTPHGRGFDTSFGYLGGAEDHYTHVASEFGCAGVDLWRTDAPANSPDYNGTYSAYMYNREVLQIIDSHNASTPLFLYVATQDMHGPNQCLEEFMSQYPHTPGSGAPGNTPKPGVDNYAVYNGMGVAADQLFGNMTAALKATGIYSNTLIVLSSDNGGPAATIVSGHAGNNWPHRGGKQTNFEGGVRVPALIGGGFLPAKARGKNLTGYVHAADWYPTFCLLAGGVDCFELTNPAVLKGDVPGVDGYNMWPYIVGDIAGSPRTEIMLDSQCYAAGSCVNGSAGKKSPCDPEHLCIGAIISGNFKLVLGVQKYGFWTGPRYPNASTDHSTERPFDCGAGCLFDISLDPGEHRDLAHEQASKFAEMTLLFHNRTATQFEAPRLKPDPAKCVAYKKAHGGYTGPYLGPPDPEPMH